MVLDSNLEGGSNSLLEPASAFAFWKKVFETPSVVDLEEPAFTRNEGLERVWQPITADEIGASLKKQKGKAKGPDGLTPEDLARIPTVILRGLFALIMASGQPPRQFKASRTVLIPKGVATADPGKYRPISIGSCILRVMHSILASRILDSVSFHESQRGFIKCDGTLHNVELLNHLIRTSRETKCPLYLASIDVAKAFDSVSWGSLFRASRGFGLCETLVSYLESFYAGSYTLVECDGSTSEPMYFGRGVKQGDPISPVLFNIMLDELFRKLPLQLGKSVGTERVNSLAFADDVVLSSKTIGGLQALVTLASDFFTKRGLSINAEKSVFMGLEFDGKRKSMYQVTDASVSVGDQPLRILPMSGAFKYLGITFSASGKQKARLQVLDDGLQAILGQKALRCEQKLYLLKVYLIPRIRHELTLGRITRGLLEMADSRIRVVVKKILHLPHHCNDSFLCLPVKLGGLGLPRLSVAVPLSLRKRYLNMQASPNTVTRALCSTTGFMKRLDWVNRNLFVKDAQGNVWPIESKESLVRNQLATSMKSSEGKGFASYGLFSFINRWIDGSDLLLRGQLFVRCLKLRWNFLIVGSTAHRGKGPPFCRLGCGEPETLNHVLQTCHGMRLAINARHDRVVRRVAKELLKTKRKVLTEPHFESDGARWRPDLVLEASPGVALVLDVACPFESASDTLDRAFSHKSHKYACAGIDEHVKAVTGTVSVRYGGLIIGSRGSISRKSYKLLINLGLSKGVIMSIIRRVMVDSVGIWSSFLRAGATSHPC
jgi:hypothetical protein